MINARLTLKSIGILLICFWLVGCHREPQEIYYLKHPDKFRSAIEYCQQQSVQTDDCQILLKQYESLTMLIKDIETDPLHFGHEIISAQIQLVQLKEKISALQTKTSLMKTEQEALMKLHNEKDTLENELAIRLQIVSEVLAPE